ncbi:fused DSP-PTPase phosphatase/NAD kinase-like protein [Candidatus Synchoanobacter obligatus]|uniref:Tyrosine specific protein phosphatases domain-containing protein n=1 Tax=Candidatus Synchoanobacter obligatus TaxID=2919597 RepID=A0ABT1L5K6_9GAMM|nr:protein-tyrosine phosphatase family protein [Candidatus Synchoanobacter obligatus]MCP8352451.1 hypothetical protein [Candidatus Synchoanobacter obligatus]
MYVKVIKDKKVVVMIKNKIKEIFSRIFKSSGTTPINYRCYDMGAYSIGGMAKPTPKILRNLTKKHGIVISLLDQSHSDRIITQYRSALPDETVLYHFHAEDFSAPSIKDFDAFNALVSEYSDRNPLVHCGAGNGRTGTYIASVILKDLIDRQDESLDGEKVIYEPQLSVFDNREKFAPKSFLMKIIQKVFLWFFPLPEVLKGNAEDKPVAPVVIKALEIARALGSESVETFQQLLALDRYAEGLQNPEGQRNVSFENSGLFVFNDDLGAPQPRRYMG